MTIRSNSHSWQYDYILVLARLIFAFHFSLSLQAANAKSPKSGWSMPDQADAIHMSWYNGPPKLHTNMEIDAHLNGFRDDHATLGFRSGHWGMLLDPRDLTINRFTLNNTTDAVTELIDPKTATKGWKKVNFDLYAEWKGEKYRPVGDLIPQDGDNYSYSPVRIIESGDWIQHVAIYDLVLVDSSGEKLSANSWLEVRAWGDRCLFEWFVEPTIEGEVQLSMSFSSDIFKQRTSDRGTSIQLALDFENSAVTPISFNKERIEVSAIPKEDYTPTPPIVTYSSSYDAWEIKIPKQHWPAKDGRAYNPDLLDRISHLDLKLENPTDQLREVSIRFVHDYHPISGYVPMMCDINGKQTGLPLQNSKNWHFKPKRRLPYDNNWINITARLTLAPNAEVDLQYAVTHALWQGLPASSAAQLCLVGWGYNGFWTQMALGSWGETICLQPGRTMRRAFITDVRPFMVKGATGKSYDWTTNVGGADIAKLVDKSGKLIPWEGAIREFKMIGPNLSHIRVTERSADNFLRMQIDSYLPRSNSINRSYYKVEIEALEDFDFQELALFQLGSDYYNDLDSRRISWGNLNELVGTKNPRLGKWGRVLIPQPLKGLQPWVSLHDEAKNSQSKGQGVRGFIVREFAAKINNKEYMSPWMTAARTSDYLNAELILHPSIRNLSKGDRINFTLELDVFPISSESYYGPSESLSDRLAKTPDSWELTAYEAKHQQLSINGIAQVFPATYGVSTKPEQEIKIRSSSSLDTICLTGLPHSNEWTIYEIVDNASLKLGERFSEEAEPQLVYIPETKDWTCVLSLRFNEKENERTFLIKRNESVLSPRGLY